MARLPSLPDQVGAEGPVNGFVTQAKYLRQQSTAALERRLGFRQGRLAKGYKLSFLLRIPRADEFEYRSYTQNSGGVAQGHLPSPPDPRNAEQRLADEGFDLPALKNRTIRKTFRVDGPDRLAKVHPVLPATGSDDYPPGSGIPQWEITALRGVPARVAALIGPGETYQGSYE